MNLVDLPIEVGILIFNYLDAKTKINIYNSCRSLRIFFAPCHAKTVVLSRSPLAALKTFNHDFFLDLGQYIQVLNLCGVPDLNAVSLKPHISRCVNLRSLDISFTNIYLSDIDDIYTASLKNLSINFFKYPKTCRKDGVWDKCKTTFGRKQFLSLHFVVFEFDDSEAPLMFLKDIPHPNDLKVTVADNYKNLVDLGDSVPYTNNIIDVKFSTLTYILRDCRVTHNASKCLKGISTLNFKEIEFIFIMYLETIIVYISPAFKSIFSECCSDLRVEIFTYLPLDFMLDGNIIFKAWNKATTEFNEMFYLDLLQELKDYFPVYVCLHNKVEMTITDAPSDWYCIDACEGFEKELDFLPEKITLTDFCRKEGIIRSCRPISLSAGSETLHNIGSIRLSNISISDDFFSVLFSECQKLSTLDIYEETRGHMNAFHGYILPLSSSIQLAKTLKNIKLTSEDVDYEILFEALSRCSTLENVHICEYERILLDFVGVDNMLLMIEKCDNLYSLFVEADMSPETLTLMMSSLREKAQVLEKDHLCIQVCDCYGGWNPFVDVFNPSPLHILD